MNIVLIAIVVVVLAVVLPKLRTFVRRVTRWKRLRSQVGGPPGLPLVGNVDMILGKTLEQIGPVFLREWPEKYGPRYTYSFGDKQFFISSIPEDVEKLLSSTVHITKGWEYDLVQDWLGDSLLLGTGSKWARRRKMLTPAFHFKILEDFVPVFNRHARTFAEMLEVKATEADGGYFDIEESVALCTLDVLCETAMGVQLDLQRNAESQYAKATTTVGELVLYRYTRPWLHPELTWKLTREGQEHKKLIGIMHDHTRKVIQERKAELNSARNLKSGDESETIDAVFPGRKKSPKAFLELLLEYQRDNPKDLTDQDIQEETETFMFAGHDTTATNINWTLRCIAEHPECQAKVHKELDAIFSGSDADREVTSEDLSRMKYLERCIKEALRLYPSVPYIARTMNADLELNDGLVVPEGSTFAIFPFVVHRNPKVFVEPEVYDPERFSPENCVGRHPFAYIPFSAGPRNCIGQKFAVMEEKIILAHVLRKYTFSADPSRKPRPLPRMVLRDLNGTQVKLSKRS